MKLLKRMSDEFDEVFGDPYGWHISQSHMDHRIAAKVTDQLRDTLQYLRGVESATKISLGETGVWTE